jgi:ABC-2 type transport system permease protein
MNARVNVRRLGVPGAVAARRMLADRGALVFAAIFYLLVGGVLAALWQTAAGPGGTIAGYSGQALTWYVFASEAAICAISQRLIEEVGDEIAAGAVTVELLRPLPVVLVRLAVQTGRRVAQLAVLVVMGGTGAWLLAGPPPSAAGALLAVPALVLAVAANLALQHTVAAVAFWLRDAKVGWFLYQKLVFILGGMLLPLEVLPGALQAVAFALPFMTMAYVPARLAAGHVEPLLLLVQAGWLAALVGTAAAVFAAGQRRLQAVGG